MIMNLNELVDDIIGFDWDKGNIDKNLVRHKVKNTETEEVFFNEPLLFYEDAKHSRAEKRYYCLGQTNERRKLFISFTIRENKLRVISARDMSRNERKIYDKETQKNSSIQN